MSGGRSGPSYTGPSAAELERQRQNDERQRLLDEKQAISDKKDQIKQAGQEAYAAGRQGASISNVEDETATKKKSLLGGARGQQAG